MTLTFGLISTSLFSVMLPWKDAAKVSLGAVPHRLLAKNMTWYPLLKDNFMTLFTYLAEFGSYFIDKVPSSFPSAFVGEV